MRPCVVLPAMQHPRSLQVAPRSAAVRGETVQCALASAQLAQHTLHLEHVQKDKPMSKVSTHVGDN